MIDSKHGKGLNSIFDFEGGLGINKFRNNTNLDIGYMRNGELGGQKILDVSIYIIVWMEKTWVGEPFGRKSTVHGEPCASQSYVQGISARETG